MGAPYYRGNTIPLLFAVSDTTGNVTPYVVNVRVKKPDGTIESTVDANIETDTVTCLIPASVTDQTGGYEVYFKMNLPNNLIRTHKMTFNVLDNR